MEYVSVIKPGMLTTIQDLGRHSYRALGVSTCGVMDQLSFKLANILVGNDKNEAALEVTLIGPRLRFNHVGMIAITGANLSSSLNGMEIPMYKSIQVETGDELSFGKCKDGVRSYIAFAGGIDVPKVMGSRSTYIRGHYGGIEGRAMTSGDTIPLGKSTFEPRFLSGRRIRYQDIPNFQVDRPIRFILGPHDDRFTKESLDDLINTPYTVSNESDRMGYRLQGTHLEHLSGADIASDFITPGTIQVPGNGQPIIHMADCGTSGGYTKIGVIIGVDLSYVAQKKPGDTINFQPIDVMSAQKEWKEQENLLHDLDLNNRLIPRR
jgi:biotin-dependent carboxylase-like uncharacterized protein